MKYTVTWTTVPKQPASDRLTQYWVSITTPTGEPLVGTFVPLGTLAFEFDLPPGEYLEKISAANRDGSVLEGMICRPITIGTPPAPTEPFAFPTWVTAPTEPEPEPPEPEIPIPPDSKATYESLMVEYGTKHGEWLATHPEASIDERLSSCYYDQCRVMYQIAEYTGDDEPWLGYAINALHVYRDEYVAPNNAGVPGYWNFTTGLREDYERTGDELSKEWAIKLSQNAAFAADYTDRTYCLTFATSREIAYAILAYINAESMGEAKRPIRAEWVTLSHEYIRQFQDVPNWGTSEVTPFMFAITAQALIEDWKETQDDRCLPALKQLADFVWPLAWDADESALFYQINPNCPGGVSAGGANDLNMLIAPWFSWLWIQTGDDQYREKFDQLLYGHKDAYVYGAKQYNQAYWWSFEGMFWREQGPTIQV